MNPNRSAVSKVKSIVEDHVSSDDPSDDDLERPTIASEHGVQCEDCLKWRRFSKQEYEEIRSKITKDPFVCNKKPNVSCKDPTDFEFDSSRTWVMDRPDIPKTPFGFQRKCVMREDSSEMDVHYVSPGGTKLRTPSDVSKLLKEYPEWNLSLSDFSFASPYVVDETVPSYAEKKGSSCGSCGTKNKRLKKAQKDDA